MQISVDQIVSWNKKLFYFEILVNVHVSIVQSAQDSTQNKLTADGQLKVDMTEKVSNWAKGQLSFYGIPNIEVFWQGI